MLSERHLGAHEDSALRFLRNGLIMITAQNPGARECDASGLGAATVVAL